MTSHRIQRIMSLEEAEPAPTSGTRMRRRTRSAITIFPRLRAVSAALAVECDAARPTSRTAYGLSLIHISEPTRLLSISYAVFCLKKKKKRHNTQYG